MQAKISDEIFKENLLLRQFIKGLQTAKEIQCRQNELLKQQVKELTHQLQAVHQERDQFGDSQQTRDVGSQEINHYYMEIRRLEQEKLILLEGCKELDSMSSILQQKQEQICRKDQLLNQLRYQIHQLEQQINRNSKFTPKQKQLAGQVQKLQRENLNLADHNEQLERQKEQIIDGYQQQLDKFRKLISELQKQVQNLNGQKSESRVSYNLEDKSSSDEVVRLKCQVQQLELQKQGLANENKIMTDLINKQNQEREKLKQSLNQQRRMHQQEVSQLNRVICEYKEEVHRKNKQFQNKQAKELQNYKKNQMEVKKTQEAHQLRKLTNQIADLKDQKSRYQRQKPNLEAKIKQLETNFSDQALDHITKIKKITRQKEELQKNLLSKDRQIKILKSENKDLETELEQKRIILLKRAESLQQLEKGILELDKQRNKQNQKYMAIIQSKNAQLKNMAQAYNKKISLMNNQLEKARKMIDELRVMMSGNEQMQLLRQQLMQMVQEIQSSRQSARQKQGLMRNLKMENKDLKNSIENYANKIQEYESRKSQVSRSKAPSWLSKGQNHDAQTNQLRQLVTNLRTQLQQVKRSKQRTQKQNMQMQNLLSAKSRYETQPQIRYHTPVEVRTHNIHGSNTPEVARSWMTHNENMDGYREETNGGPKTLYQNTESKFYVRKPLTKPISQSRPEKNVEYPDEIGSPQHYKHKSGRRQFVKKEPLYQTEYENGRMSKLGPSMSIAQSYNSRNEDKGWNHNLQDRINILKKQNKQLKKVLFN